MMFVVFWMAFILIIYPYILYPLLVIMSSILFGRKIDKKKEIFPRVSMIISAYNEEKVIKDKLENTLALNYPRDKLEIVVASESSDKTNEIVNEYKDKGVRLCAYTERKGKPSTIFRTFPSLKGDIVVFSDANSMYEKDSLKHLVGNFNDPEIGCVCGRLQYVSKKESSPIGKGEGMYWNFDNALKMRLSKLRRLGGGVNGSIFAIRKGLYFPINEFRGDDFELSNRVEIAGHGVVFEPEAVSYEESSETSKQEFTRKIRLAAWNLKSATILFAESIKKKKWVTSWIIISHRLMRYSSPLWLMILFVSNFFMASDNLYYFIFFLLQITFYLLAFWGYLGDKQGNRLGYLNLFPFYFCLMNCAALLGTLNLLLTGDKTTWEKTR